MSNIWYISKYANILPYGNDSRHASFCRVFAERGNKTRLITSNSSHLSKTLPNFKGSYKDMDYSGFEVTWVNTPKYKFAASIKRVLTWLWFEVFVILMAFRKKYEKPDVVIVSSLSILSVLSGCFYKKFYKSRLIFEVRDIWPQTLIDLNGMSESNPFIWCLSKVESLGYRYADKIVGTMPGLYLHVESKVGMGAKVHFIPQGVSLDFYKNSQELLSKEFIQEFIPKNKFIVTYTGTLGKANAMEYVIEAASLLNKEGNKDFVFLIVGEGGAKADLIKMATGLDNVIFAPSVKKNQVQHVLLASDLLIASVRNESIYKTGLSLNKFVDYMYSKKPIVCMFSGFPALLNESGCGEFTPAEDSKQFINVIKKYQKMSPKLRAEMGMKGHDFLIKSRNFDILGKQFMELFK